MLRHELLGRIGRRRLGRAVKVADRDRAILEGKGREERLGETMLLDQPLTNDPKDLCPDFADGVNSPVPGLVECLVRGRVDGFVLWSSQYQTQ